jgi:hypothetical protein
VVVASADANYPVVIEIDADTNRALGKGFPSKGRLRAAGLKQKDYSKSIW